MKKQLFSFLMVLALVVLAGTSAMAQTATSNGLTPTTARLAVVGSVSAFTQAETGANDATYAWTILEIDPADGLAATGTSTVGTGGRFVTSAGVTTGASTTDATVYIQWLAAPATTGNVYAIQCTATTSTTGQGTCTTIRRFFVTVFDYDVDIYLSDATGAKLGSDADITDECNSWSGKIITNSLESTALTVADHDLTHNGNATTDTPAGIEKTTTTYFTVEITTSGPAVNLSALNWRLLYSMPAAADLSLYQIDNIGTNQRAQFSTIGGDNVITGAEVLTIASSAINADGNNVLFFPAGGSATTSEKFIFEVRTHNNLGANKMVMNMRVDQTGVALQPSGTLANADFNDGIKYNSALNIADAQTLKDGTSGTKTIMMSPASSIITIVD